jgi:hypothetical protein
MTEIAIYNSNGIQINSIVIPESLEYINGRVSKGQKYYYKGIGVPYKNHFIPKDEMTDDYIFLSESDVFYLGNIVSKPTYQNKFGIFQEKYQPHFTDWIGSCGIKELNIFENLYDEKKFEMNGIEVFGYEIIDELHQQYFLKVDYIDGRQSYLDNPNPKGLRNLIDYMIQNDWNFPWDKNSITDISSKSNITDVADIFNSNELMHKIGSIYSILYSLYNANKSEYFNFCKHNNLKHINIMSFIFNTIALLEMNNLNLKYLYKNKNPMDVYKDIILNYLIMGKNCGFCGVGSCKTRIDPNLSYGEFIKNEYIKKSRLDLKV